MRGFYVPVESFSLLKVFIRFPPNFDAANDYSILGHCF